MAGVVRYEKLTWPEVDRLSREDRVVLIPAGTLEDHGPHLPLDTDVVIAGGVCERAAALVPADVVLFPPIVHGYSPHHMDFPGPITIRWDTFVEWVLDVTRSLAHHGFRRMLIVNGHGSNVPPLELAARLTIVERPEVLCAFCSWWDLSAVRQAWDAVGESAFASHACEAETSLYLALDGARVRMENAVPDLEGYQTSPHFWANLMGRPYKPGLKNPVRMMAWWSTFSATGTRGDPTKATAEKGLRLLEAAAGELAEVIRELRAREIRGRVDRHGRG